jgi:phage shock protein PspC (stress-responsive transcriptional regulator)
MEKKKLYRSRYSQVLGGVCAGVAKYLGWEESIVRVLTLAGALFTILPITLIYIVCWIVIPKEPKK